MTAEDLIDWLETTIDDSFDLGWTSRDAATLIVSRMQAEGLVMAHAQPAADLFAESAKNAAEQIAESANCSELVDELAAALRLAERELTAVSHSFATPHHPTLVMIRAALSRYAKGGA